MKHIFQIVLVFLLISPLAAKAETVFRIGKDISVDSDQVVNGDYYTSVGPFGNTDMSGKVEGDALILAGNAILNGDVSGDTLIVAGVTQVNGAVGDDVRVIAGEATISDEVKGDLFVMAGTLKLLSSAHVLGNVYFFGGDATIQGSVDGSVFGTAERMRIDGVVGHDVDIKVPGGLTLGEKANIAGSVQYTSASEIVRAQGSVVEKTIQKREPVLKTEKENARSLLTPIFIILFAALSLYLLFKRELNVLVARVDESIGYSIVAGAAVLLAGPIATVLLLFTVLGLILGIMLLGSLLLIYSMAIALTGVVAGSFMFKYFTGKLNVTLASVVVGTVFLQILLLVPVLGTLTFSFVLMLTLGGLVRSLYNSLQT